jgi:hypothetical protein
VGTEDVVEATAKTTKAMKTKAVRVEIATAMRVEITAAMRVEKTKTITAMKRHIKTRITIRIRKVLTVLKAPVNQLEELEDHNNKGTRQLVSNAHLLCIQ